MTPAERASCCSVCASSSVESERSLLKASDRMMLMLTTAVAVA
jgi:hypothetical protein